MNDTRIIQHILSQCGLFHNRCIRQDPSVTIGEPAGNFIQRGNAHHRIADASPAEYDDPFRLIGNLRQSIDQNISYKLMLDQHIKYVDSKYKFLV